MDSHSRSLSRATADGGIPLARSMVDARRSPLVDLLRDAAGPDVISFAVGVPAAELFPAAGVAASCARVLARPEALQYGVPSPRLRAQIVDLMALRGVRCRPQQVFLATGAQQGMDLLVRLLLDPGGEVMLEDLVYEGVRLAMRPLTPRLVSVPTSPQDGLDVDAVAAHLAAGVRPAFLYVIPEAHNPLGVSLSGACRRRLAELARRHRMPIIEDDAYGFLSYDGERRPALRALDERWVLYLGSFSKIMGPGLRIGWIVVPEDLVDRLSALKHGMDVDSCTFAQHVLSDHLDTIDFEAHLESVRRAYRRRRDVLAGALERHAPPGLRWWLPAGGFYVWAELPEGLDATHLLRHALAEERVVFTPGSAFAAAGHERAARSLRLSFAGAPIERIDEGVRRLSRAFVAVAETAMASV